MDKKTFVITTDQNSDYDACMSPILCKYDYIQFRNPESVIVMNGHEKLYDEDALDRARRAGEDAAWNLARKIVCSPTNDGYSVATLNDIFGSFLAGDCLRNYTCREAANKINEWEEKQAKTLHIGDVLVTPADTKALVTCIIPGYTYLMYSDGSCKRETNEDIEKFYKKTSQCFDPSPLFDQLKDKQ